MVRGRLTAVLLMALLGLVTARALGDAATPMLSKENVDARKIKLAQMAVAVNELSLGKSRLMIRSATSAAPGAGRFMKTVAQNGETRPFLTVYPVSIPVTARMQVTTQDGAVVRQYGRLLGVVEVTAPVGGSDDKKKADPDLYFLFTPVDGPLLTQMPLWLVSLKVVEDGKVTQNVVAHTTVKIAPSKLGDKDTWPVVTAGIDFLKTSVSMTWKEQTYSFSFDMEIIYL